MGIPLEIAESLDDALERLGREGPDLRPVAGATDVLLRLEAGRLKAKKLLAIGDLKELDAVRARPDGVEIGALAKVADLLGNELFVSEFRAGAQAAREFASPQIRNRATLGGNIGNASPAADMVPPLIALGAQVTLRSRKGTRTLALEDLFAGPGKTHVAPDELIVGLTLPRRRHAFQSFRKFGNRGANVIAIVNTAICLQLEGERIAEARVAYGCCGPTPMRARAVERYLGGQALGEGLVRGVREAILQDIRPIDDVRGSRRYKQMLAIHATEDALRAAVASLRQAA